MADFDLVDALRKLRYGPDYAQEHTFSSPEDKALAVASGAGANKSGFLGNAAEDILNTYAPRDPADRVSGQSVGQSLGDQTREAARKNPGAAATGNLAVTAPLRTAATLAAGPASLPAETLLQGLLGGAEGAYAAQEGDRTRGAARGAAASAALPLAVGGARALGTGLANGISNMPPPSAPAAASEGLSLPKGGPRGVTPEEFDAATSKSVGGGSKAIKPPTSANAAGAAAQRMPKSRLPAEAEIEPAPRPKEFEGEDVSKPGKTPEWTKPQEDAARSADAAAVRAKQGIADSDVFKHEAEGRAKAEGRFPRGASYPADAPAYKPSPTGAPTAPPVRGGSDDFGALLSDVPPPAKTPTGLPPSTPEAQAAAAMPIPKAAKTFNMADYAPPAEGYQPKDMPHAPSRPVNEGDDLLARAWMEQRIPERAAEEDAQVEKQLADWLAQGGDTF